MSHKIKKLNICFHFKKEIDEEMLNVIWADFFDAIGLFSNFDNKKNEPRGQKRVNASNLSSLIEKTGKTQKGIELVLSLPPLKAKNIKNKIYNKKS